MTRRALLALSAVIAVGAVAYIAVAANGGGDRAAANARAMTGTPSAIPADAPLADRLSGRLTYRTGKERVTTQFPAAAEVSREPDGTEKYDLTSADGVWRAHHSCTVANSPQCALDLIATDGRTGRLDVDADLQWSRDVQWSPRGHVLAIDYSVDSSTVKAHLSLIDDPASGAARVIAANARTFAWVEGGDALAVAIDARDGTGAMLRRISTDGRESAVAPLGEMPNYLYPAPNSSIVAFTMNSVAGWNLETYDASAGEVRDLGPMGSDGPGATPVVRAAPDVKVPMYIAWSPDGSSPSKIAFGGGFEPPYTMTIVDIASGAKLTTNFTDGYPGEIRWTRDGRRLAVSTYNLERTHHETYVVDPVTGIAMHVIAGCIIVWSPDGRFLAVHGEREPGIVIADVDTGEHLQLTHVATDAPLSWVAD